MAQRAQEAVALRRSNAAVVKPQHRIGWSGNTLILALTEDWFLIPRLEDAARAVGARLEVAARPEDLGASGDPAPRAVPLTEPVEGADAAMVRRIVAERPRLILMDSEARDLPWECWLQVLKTSAATRRIPIVVFGPYVEGDVLARARALGADQVLARGHFLGDLPELLRAALGERGDAEVETSCRQPLSEHGSKGLAEIEAGRFFEAHEFLEQAWMAESPPAGILYRCLLQLAVAYLQIERGNYRGAVKMLLRLPQWLDRLPEECRGVDVSALRGHVARLRQAVEQAGPQHVGELTSDWLRPIPRVRPSRISREKGGA